MSVLENLKNFKAWFSANRLQEDSFASDIHRMGDEIADWYLYKGVTPVVIFKVKILDSMRSHYDNSHAGALTTLVDWLTHLAGAADPSYWPKDRPANEDDFRRVQRLLGLSRRLSLQYLKEVPLGIEVFVKCMLLENTKSRQYFVVEIYDKDRVYLRGTHDKIKLYKRIKGREEPESRDAFGTSAKL